MLAECKEFGVWKAVAEGERYGIAASDYVRVRARYGQFDRYSVYESLYLPY
jgi:hypothetical protein